MPRAHTGAVLQNAPVPLPIPVRATRADAYYPIWRGQNTKQKPAQHKRMARDERWLLKLADAEVETFYDLARDPFMQGPPIKLDTAGEDARNAHARLGAWLAQLPRDANVPFDGYRGQTWRAVPQVLQPPLRFAVDDSYGWHLADSKAPVGECFVSNASGGDGTAHEPVLNAAVGDLAARPSARPEAAMPHMDHALARGAAKSPIRHAPARAPWQPGLAKQRPHGSRYPGS